MQKIILLVFLVFVMSGNLTNSFAQQPSSMQKFILKTDNDLPSNSVELRLVINHGSLSETDKELGFAHLVEHIAFNDTAKYPNETLIPFLEKSGLAIGIHSNASTGFDYTMYQLSLKDPDAKKLELAIEVLAQWAMHVQFNQKVIDAEKPVVKEEWRSSETDKPGWQSKLFDTEYAGSHYLNREPIGDMGIIEAASAKDLEAFYRRWYQPQNAAVIVTGDIDTKQVNTLVDQYFADWKSDPETTQTEYFVPVKSIPKVQVIPDVNVDGSFVSFSFYQNYPRANDVEGAFQSLSAQAGLHILTQRLNTHLHDTKGAVGSAAAYTTYLTPKVLKTLFNANLSGGKIDTGIQYLIKQMNQFFQQGITQAELDNARNSLLGIMRLNQESSSDIASMAVDHFLFNTPLLRHASWLKTLEKRLPSLTEKDVNDAVRHFISKQAAKLLVVHNPTITPPNNNALSALVDKIDVTQSTASTAENDANDNSKIDQMWAIAPKDPGELTQTTRFKNGLIEWKFSNNTSVVFKPDSSQPNKIFYILSDTHGTRYLTQEQTIHARLAMETMVGSGLRDLSGPELSQWLDNNVIFLSPAYAFWNKAIQGNSAVKNFETVMNLIHVMLTEARVSPSARDHFLELNKQVLLSNENSTVKPWQDTMHQKLLQNDTAFRNLTLDEVESTTVSDMQTLYKQSFAGAQQYRLSLVGDISEEEAFQTILKTLATLPKSEITTKKPRDFPRISTAETTEIAGSGLKSASLTYKLTLAKTELPNISFLELSYLHLWLRSALMAELREKEGLVYSVNVAIEGGVNDLRDHTLTIDLACDPDKVDRVKASLIKILKQQAETPITAERAKVWINEARSQLELSLERSGTLVAEINSLPFTWISLENVMDVDFRTRLENPKVLNETLSVFLSDKAIPTTLIWMP